MNHGDAYDPPERDDDEVDDAMVRKFWISVLACLLMAAVGFFGAAIFVHWLVTSWGARWE